MLSRSGLVKEVPFVNKGVDVLAEMGYGRRKKATGKGKKKRAKKWYHSYIISSNSISSNF